jgi:glycosyltransferase involved in cell wall biosynthesis
MMVRTEAQSKGLERGRIAILSGAVLARNPRVLKEAMALAQAGYSVTVLGAEYEPGGCLVDQELARNRGFCFVSVGSVAEAGVKGKVARIYRRARSRLARLAFHHFRIESRYQLGYFAPELYRQAKALRADFYIAHVEAGLWAGMMLGKIGRRVGVDMEDWYSEDLPPEARRARPLGLLSQLERTLLNHAACAFCPSEVMAVALAEAYACPAPTVIYNAFEWAERDALPARTADMRNRHRRSIHWYSQTVGPGRGLEDLFAALPLLKGDVEINLRGSPMAGLDEWLGRQLPGALRDRVRVHGLVTNEELLGCIAEHDLGFAGEMTYCRSRDLTVTNKILHYLLAGLPVVASDTAGQREVAGKAEGAVFLYAPGDIAGLAGRINALMGKQDAWEDAHRAALLAAQTTFCWERMAPRLVGAVDQAVSARALPRMAAGARIESGAR